jgi:hypothetical protein
LLWRFPLPRLSILFFLTVRGLAVSIFAIMKWSTVFLAAWVGLAAAHGGAGDIPGMPKIVGGRKFMAKIRSELQQKKRELNERAAKVADIERAKRSATQQEPPTRVQRAPAANTDGQCGPGMFL